MSTLTTKKVNKRVDFFNTSKGYDWRYQKYQSLKKGEVTEETTYWIGVVDLIPVRKSQKNYTIGCSWCRNEVQNDRYHERDVDGSPCAWYDTRYDLSKIIEELSKARDNGYNYFHLLLEEKVDQYGKHEVNIVYNEYPQPGSPIGIASKKPWYLEPVKDWLHYASQTISEETKRICILQNEAYVWLK